MNPHSPYGGLRRHEEYYITTGDLHFVVDRTRFRVHRYFYERESDYFRSILLAPISPGATRQGTTDENAIELDYVTSDEFAKFNWVFYNPKFSIYDKGARDWHIVLRLAHRWRFPNVHELAVRELDKLYVPDIDRVAMYQDYDVDRRKLVPCYAALAQRAEPIALDEGERLGLETVIMLAQARELARAGPERALAPVGLRPEEMQEIVRDVFDLDGLPGDHTYPQAYEGMSRSGSIAGSPTRRRFTQGAARRRASGAMSRSTSATYSTATYSTPPTPTAQRYTLQERPRSPSPPPPRSPTPPASRASSRMQTRQTTPTARRIFSPTIEHGSPLPPPPKRRQSVGSKKIKSRSPPPIRTSYSALNGRTSGYSTPAEPPRIVESAPPPPKRAPELEVSEAISNGKGKEREDIDAWSWDEDDKKPTRTPLSQNILRSLERNGSHASSRSATPGFTRRSTSRMSNIGGRRSSSRVTNYYDMDSDVSVTAGAESFHDAEDWQSLEDGEEVFEEAVAQIPPVDEPVAPVFQPFAIPGSPETPVTAVPSSSLPSATLFDATPVDANPAMMVPANELKEPPAGELKKLPQAEPKEAIHEVKVKPWDQRSVPETPIEPVKPFVDIMSTKPPQAPLVQTPVPSTPAPPTTASPAAEKPSLPTPEPEPIVPSIEVEPPAPTSEAKTVVPIIKPKAVPATLPDEPAAPVSEVEPTPSSAKDKPTPSAGKKGKSKPKSAPKDEVTEKSSPPAEGAPAPPTETTSTPPAEAAPAASNAKVKGKRNRSASRTKGGKSAPKDEPAPRPKLERAPIEAAASPPVLEAEATSSQLEAENANGGALAPSAPQDVPTPSALRVEETPAQKEPAALAIEVEITPRDAEVEPAARPPAPEAAPPSSKATAAPLDAKAEGPSSKDKATSKKSVMPKDRATSQGEFATKIESEPVVSEVKKAVEDKPKSEGKVDTTLPGVKAEPTPAPEDAPAAPATQAESDSTTATESAASATVAPVPSKDTAPTSEPSKAEPAVAAEATSATRPTVEHPEGDEAETASLGESGPPPPPEKESASPPVPKEEESVTAEPALIPVPGIDAANGEGDASRGKALSAPESAIESKASSAPDRATSPTAPQAAGEPDDAARDDHAGAIDPGKESKPVAPCLDKVDAGPLPVPSTCGKDTSTLPAVAADLKAEETALLAQLQDSKALDSTSSAPHPKTNKEKKMMKKARAAAEKKAAAEAASRTSTPALEETKAPVETNADADEKASDAQTLEATTTTTPPASEGPPAPAQPEAKTGATAKEEAQAEAGIPQKPAAIATVPVIDQSFQTETGLHAVQQTQLPSLPDEKVEKDSIEPSPPAKELELSLVQGEQTKSTAPSAEEKAPLPVVSQQQSQEAMSSNGLVQDAAQEKHEAEKNHELDEPKEALQTVSDTATEIGDSLKAPVAPPAATKGVDEGSGHQAADPALLDASTELSKEPSKASATPPVPISQTTKGLSGTPKPHVESAPVTVAAATVSESPGLPFHAASTSNVVMPKPAPVKQAEVPPTTKPLGLDAAQRSASSMAGPAPISMSPLSRQTSTSPKSAAKSSWGGGWLGGITQTLLGESSPTEPPRQVSPQTAARPASSQGRPNCLQERLAATAKKAATSAQTSSLPKDKQVAPDPSKGPKAFDATADKASSSPGKLAAAPSSPTTRKNSAGVPTPPAWPQPPSKDSALKAKGVTKPHEGAPRRDGDPIKPSNDAVASGLVSTPEQAIVPLPGPAEPQDTGKPDVEAKGAVITTTASQPAKVDDTARGDNASVESPVAETADAEAKSTVEGSAREAVEQHAPSEGTAEADGSPATTDVKLVESASQPTSTDSTQADDGAAKPVSENASANAHADAPSAPTPAAALDGGADGTCAKVEEAGTEASAAKDTPDVAPAAAKGEDAVKHVSDDGSDAQTAKATPKSSPPPSKPAAGQPASSGPPTKADLTEANKSAKEVATVVAKSSDDNVVKGDEPAPASHDTANGKAGETDASKGNAVATKGDGEQAPAVGTFSATDNATKTASGLAADDVQSVEAKEPVSVASTTAAPDAAAATETTASQDPVPKGQDASSREGSLVDISEPVSTGEASSTVNEKPGDTQTAGPRMGDASSAGTDQGSPVEEGADRGAKVEEAEAKKQAEKESAVKPSDAGFPEADEQAVPSADVAQDSVNSAVAKDVAQGPAPSKGPATPSSMVVAPNDDATGASADLAQAKQGKGKGKPALSLATGGKPQSKGENLAEKASGADTPISTTAGADEPSQSPTTDTRPSTPGGDSTKLTKSQKKTQAKKRSKQAKKGMQ